MACYVVFHISLIIYTVLSSAVTTEEFQGEAMYGGPAWLHSVNHLSTVSLITDNCLNVVHTSVRPVFSSCFLCPQGNKCLHQCKPTHPPNQPHTADLQNRGLAFRDAHRLPPLSCGEPLLEWRKLEEHLTYICKLERVDFRVGGRFHWSRYSRFQFKRLKSAICFAFSMRIFQSWNGTEWAQSLVFSDFIWTVLIYNPGLVGSRWGEVFIKD